MPMVAATQVGHMLHLMITSTIVVTEVTSRAIGVVSDRRGTPYLGEMDKLVDALDRLCPTCATSDPGDASGQIQN